MTREITAQCCNIGLIKVKQKMASFGSEILKPGKLNISLGQKLGIENPDFETQILDC